MEKYQEEYKKYIINHKANVEKAYHWLLDNLGDEIDFGDKDKLAKLISQHDLSKWGEEEFEPYALYFNVDKSKYEKEFNYAWLHHIHCNPHHWQYWVLKHDDEPEEALEMPQEYIIEMICDWWSFSHKVGKLNEIFNWYKQHKDMTLNDKTRKAVETILDKIKEKI